jgi:alkanesulfonate monooxygenase SsuD/methylene tetrahydromethanopterin reductase-like flavin-dependent oxidoreductase (luciferase family)
MSQRNEIFDESLAVLRGVWSEGPFTHQGKHFSARGLASLPGPAQRGGPPVLIGGNSALARARAARNQGWSPLMVRQEVAQTSRTPGIATVAELAARIKEVRDAAAADGAPAPMSTAPMSTAPMSTAPLTIQVHTPQAGFMQRPGSAEEHREHLGQLADAGVDSFVLRPPGDSVDHAVGALQQYAKTFLTG